MSEVPRLVTANRGDAGRRLDLMLRGRLTDLHAATRTRVQAWIESGQVSVNGTAVRRVATRVHPERLLTATLTGSSGERNWTDATQKQAARRCY